MHTGICPSCKVRRVLVKINYVTGAPDQGNVLRVRTHECGSLLEPRDVQPLPRLVTKRPVHA
jgi:hypothetical protein